MALYFLKRALLSLPTLIGISLVCFVLIQVTPGGPVDQLIAQWKSAGIAGEGSADQSLMITDEQRQLLNEYYGFDKPLWQRYFVWLGKVVRLDFGESYFYEEPVLRLIKERLPISLTFGIVSFILTYLICIPLGILKALKHNTFFDSFSSGVVFFLYSIPSFALGIVLIVLLCGGSFWNVFPIEGFTSDGFSELGFFGKAKDIAYHMFLPLVCYTSASFAFLTLLMKNSLIEQLKQDYITTARAKGLSETRVILKHALRNALLPIATGFGHFLEIFFAGNILVEQIFGLQGIGLLSYNAVVNRDYPVVMATILISSMMLVVGNMISDFLYVVIDPRIDYQ